MIGFSNFVKILLLITVSGILSACQEGHSFSNRYQNAIPVQKQTKKIAKPIPKLRDKPWRKSQKPPHKTAVAPKSNSSNRGTMIIVRKGDTIYALSRRHDVTVRAIIQKNNLRPPYLLYPGQKLKSPATGIYAVKKGDTVYSLSRKYSVDMPAFTRLNNLKRPYALSIGQKLRVPNGSRVQKKGQNKTYIPLPQSGKGFMWPVKGVMISSFGAKAKGYHNDGINISAKLGSYVRAAESGVVVHAGSKIKGFGKLILIRHSGGWITAYAHNSALLIKKGQHIKRGQAISRVGQTGGVNRPQLHFEMRKGSRAINPVPYLTG